MAILFGSSLAESLTGSEQADYILGRSGDDVNLGASEDDQRGGGIGKLEARYADGNTGEFDQNGDGAAGIRFHVRGLSSSDGLTSADFV